MSAVERVKALVTVAVLIVVAAAIRFGLQHGKKPLREVHPWDYVLMIVTVVAAAAYLFWMHRRTASTRQKEAGQAPPGGSP